MLVQRLTCPKASAAVPWSSFEDRRLGGLLGALGALGVGGLGLRGRWLRV